MAELHNGMDAKRVKVASVFGHLERAAPDTVFHIKTCFLADKHPKKVNLGIGGRGRGDTSDV